MLRIPLKIILCRVGPSRWMPFAALALAVLIPELASAQYTLERVVLVSRHGVRSPTNTSPPLSEVASKTWPTWLVASPGDLTPRGEGLATLMGEYYRHHFAAALGLQSVNGCPGQNEVYVWADVAQRTRHTGDGLLAGAFPGCGLYAQHLPLTNPIDPLFHPVSAGVCKVDKNVARDEILLAACGTPSRRESKCLKYAWDRQPYGGALRKLQRVLDCCSPKLCQPPGGACTLEKVQSSIVEKRDSVGLSGPIPIGSTAAEVFLLEYAQDMSLVAWQRGLSQTDIVSMMWLHSLEFELVERTRHLASRQGSALLWQVFETLRQTAERTSRPQDQVPPESKLVIYVGHDTNLANIGGMLGVDWQLTTYLRNETPPAGAMAFELLRHNKSTKLFVRMSYYSQSPDQMRSATRLIPPNKPPDRAQIVPRCEHREDGACPWHEFHDWVQQSVDLDCTLPARR
jgi:4-phytase / acid phosphatase